VFAREQGALVPARQVASAKSWLSNAAVDRTAPLLPWASEGPLKLSPVEASARVLRHLRDAWNHEHPGDAARGQPIVLTVPASFDEEARELTVQAARAAGFATSRCSRSRWPRSTPGSPSRHRTKESGPGQTCLRSALRRAARSSSVCDVGGGTPTSAWIRGGADFIRTAELDLSSASPSASTCCSAATTSTSRSRSTSSGC
jgi:hypothetical protein